MCHQQSEFFCQTSSFHLASEAFSLGSNTSLGQDSSLEVTVTPWYMSVLPTKTSLSLVMLANF